MIEHREAAPTLKSLEGFQRPRAKGTEAQPNEAEVVCASKTHLEFADERFVRERPSV